jgi:hypothetical protein
VSSRQTAATWLVAQCEPLMATLDRAVADEALLALCLREPEWATWWFAGVVADQMGTLPPGDPWLVLPARVTGAGMVRGVSVAVPTRTGARGVGGAFGTIGDGLDLVGASFTEAPVDIGLAAISAGLSDGGAALLAFAADGWAAAAAAARGLHREHLLLTGDKAKSAGRYLEDLSGAFRWAAWRRQAYVGRGDDWVLASGFAWLWRADELTAHGELPAGEATEIDRALSAEAIDRGAYGALADHGS